MEFTLRALVPDDAARLALLHHDPLLPVWETPVFLNMLGTRTNHGLAAEREGEVAGFLLWREVAGEAEILTLVVASSFRRQGIARQLLEGMERSLLENDVERLFLEVGADNPVAMQLYEKNGFVRISTRKGYYLRGAGVVDALILQKTLHSSD